MPMRIACPHCRAAYTVAAENAGKRAKCRACGGWLRVPARIPELVPVAPDPGADGAEPDGPEARPMSGPDWDDGPGPAWPASGLATAAIVVWVLTGLGVFAAAAVWLLFMAQARSAVHETFASATAAALLVGLYVLARSVEKVLAAVGARRRA